MTFAAACCLQLSCLEELFLPGNLPEPPRVLRDGADEPCCAPFSKLRFESYSQHIDPLLGLLWQIPAAQQQLDAVLSKVKRERAAFTTAKPRPGGNSRSTSMASAGAGGSSSCGSGGVSAGSNLILAGAAVASGHGSTDKGIKAAAGGPVGSEQWQQVGNDCPTRDQTAWYL